MLSLSHYQEYAKKMYHMVFCVEFFCIFLLRNADGIKASLPIKTDNIYPNLILKNIFWNSFNLKYGFSAQTEKII